MNVKLKFESRFRQLCNYLELLKLCNPSMFRCFFGTVAKQTGLLEIVPLSRNPDSYRVRVRFGHALLAGSGIKIWC